MALFRNPVLTFEFKTRETCDMSIMLWEINLCIKIKDILISENLHDQKKKNQKKPCSKAIKEHRT